MAVLLIVRLDFFARIFYILYKVINKFIQNIEAMTNNDRKLYQFFRKNKGVLRFSNVVKAGLDPIYLKRLVAKGQIEKIGHGLYQLKDAPALSNPDLVTAILQSPKSVVCLISALSFHEATDQIPHHIDLAIPVGSRTNKIGYPPVKFFYFSNQSWKTGIEIHKIDGYEVRIYSLPKTIADCFKFRNKIGFDVAIKALKVAVEEKKVRVNEIMKFAKICRVDNVIRPYLEALI